MDLEPTSGHEQQGRRPVLVISVQAFNTMSGLAMIAPITRGGGFARRAGFAVSLDGTGARTTGVVRCDQIRTLDLVARKGMFVEHVAVELVDTVVAKMLAYVGWE